MPTITNTILNFVTFNQSLWSPGDARQFRISTEDLLVYRSGELTYDFDFDIWVAGASGQLYLSFYAGLEAYAELVDSGHFDAAYTFSVNVEHDTAVLITQNSTVNFDFSDWSVQSARLTSEGFSGSPGAGLDFVFGAEAGIRNLEYFAFGLNGEVAAQEFFDFDARIPIIEVNGSSVEFDGFGNLTEVAFSPYPGIEISARLPTGADTFGQTFGSLEVTSRGRSDTKFIELDIDVDEVIIELASKIPKIGKIIESIGAVVFAEYEYDLADYISFIPEGKVSLEATVFDIQANAGIYLTETLSLEVQTPTAPVSIVLRSDNGTPGDYSDDKVVTTQLGSDVDIGVPDTNALNQDLSDGLGSGVGVFTVTAYYDLAEVDYDHSVGLGIEASLTITALRAFFGGDWVPDELSVDFGPLLEVVFPEGGFETDLFDFFSNDYTTTEGQFANTPTSGTDPSTWGYETGTFNQVTDTYEVFATNSAPNGWDPEAPGAVQQIYVFREALQENFQAAIGATESIWENDQVGTAGQFIATLDPGATFINPVSSATLVGELDGTPTTITTSGFVTDFTLFWDASVTSQVQVRQATDNNHVIVAPADAATLGYSDDQDLKVNFIAATESGLQGGAYYLNDFVGVDDGFGAIAGVLDALDVQMRGIAYEYGNHELRSANTPNVIGRDGDDILVRAGNHTTSSPAAELFDGDSGFDVFVANYLQSDPNLAISFDWSDVNPNDGVQIGDVTVKNAEGFVIRTGNADDFLVGGGGINIFETSGGDDYIRFDKDNGASAATGGDGSDVLIVDGQQGLESGNFRALFGGTGLDVGVVRFESDDPNVIQSNLQINLSVGTNDLSLSYDSGVLDFVFFQIAHQGQVLDSATPQTDLDLYNDFKSADYNDLDSFDYLAYNSTHINAYFATDVETIDVIAGDRSSDAVYYTGGRVYDGGDGLVRGSSTIQTTDTLFASFSSYEAFWGVSTGVTLIAEDRIGATGGEIGLSYYAPTGTLV